MLLEAIHTTQYRYEDRVSQCFSEARLRPRDFAGQRVHASRIRVEPEPASTDERVDYFGNLVTSTAIFRGHDRFVTTAESVVEIIPPTPGLPEVSWEQVRDLTAAALDSQTFEAFEYTFESPFVSTHPELAAFGEQSFPPARPIADAVLELCHRIHSDFTYLPKSTRIDTPLMDVFKNRCGVCQDFSHVMIGVLRSLRLPARYISGYLRSGTQFQGAEASHAWVAVYVPGAGWVHYDPTNDVLPATGHVTVAWGRDYGDVTPVKGIALGGGEQTVDITVSVRPLDPQDLAAGKQ